MLKGRKLLYPGRITVTFTNYELMTSQTHGTEPVRVVKTLEIFVIFMDHLQLLLIQFQVVHIVPGFTPVLVPVLTHLLVIIATGVAWVQLVLLVMQPHPHLLQLMSRDIVMVRINRQ